MRREYLNFFKNIYRQNLFLIITFYAGIVIEKVRSKLFPGKFYPSRAQAIRGLQPQGNVVIRVGNVEPIDFIYKTSLVTLESSHQILWDELKKLSLDAESEAGLHRWYWLLYNQETLQSLMPITIIELVKQWLSYYGNKKTSQSWQSYTVSERISSFTIALLLKEEFSEIKKIIREENVLNDFLLSSVDHLRNNLEYYPGGITFNHVVNDLKGLVSSSVLLDDNKLLDQSFTLLQTELEIILDKDGFLREGSSHYQLIVTRWLCELSYILMKASKEDYARKLQPFIDLTLEKSFFFIIECKNENSFALPLIGDVSPDFDPDWLIEYFTSFYQNGNHYGKVILEHFASILTSSINYHDKGVYSFESYTRIEKWNWSAIIKHSDCTQDVFPDHSHEDEAHFVLYYLGYPVVIDTGRANYDIPYYLNNYCLASSHNGPITNGVSAFVTRNYAYLPNFCKGYRNLKNIYCSQNELQVTFETDAVKRIKTGHLKKIVRSFTFSKMNLTIQDKVWGRGAIDLNYNLVLAKDISIKNNIYKKSLVLESNRKFALEVSANTSWEEGKVRYSPKYLQESDTAALLINISGENFLEFSMSFSIIKKFDR